MLQISFWQDFCLTQHDCNIPRSLLILIISAAFHERKIQLSRYLSKSSMDFSILLGKWLNYYMSILI